MSVIRFERGLKRLLLLRRPGVSYSGDMDERFYQSKIGRKQSNLRNNSRRRLPSFVSI